MNRFACLVSLVTFTGFGCRGAPSDMEKSSSKAGPSGASQAPEIEEMTVGRCGVGFRGRISSPPGEVIQEETAQTKACLGDECPGKTLGMISPPSFYGKKTCAEIVERLVNEPVVDAWGAQARVYCNDDIVQSISAGRDGKLGTCDDLAATKSLRLPRHRILRAGEAPDESVHDSPRSGQPTQSK